MHSYGLAPMEGVTDFATRLWFAKVSAPKFCWTPFHRATYSSTGILPQEFAPELNEVKGYVRYELIPQVMTGEPDHFCKVAERVLRFSDFVDLNCGCPSPTVVGRGAGSSALETADKFYNLVSKISECLGPNKLSVKMRLGFNSSGEFYKLVESIGTIKLRHLTIHGRTRAQKYLGKADWDLIAWGSEKSEVPVIGSGDIFSYETYKKSIQLAPKVKTRLIGRGAVRNPWVFSEIDFGQAVQISLEGLLFALASFAKLQEMEKRAFEDLIEFVKEGLFLETCGVEEERWRVFFQKISGLQKIEDLHLSSFGFARLKMIWNHLRTSLPEGFWIPDPLRAKSVRDFFCCIKTIGGGDFLELKHKDEWDWLFGGEKR